MQASAVLSPSPSLSSYSTGTLAEIAARVVDELRLDTDPFCWDAVDFGRASTEQGEETGGGENGRTQFDNEDVEEAEEGEVEFEFAIVCGGGPGSSPIAADEIFCNGQIRPVYPVFDRDLLLKGVPSREKGEDDSKKTAKHRLPLKKLLSEEREWTSSSSSSSSESEELDGLAPGSYCVWRPKASLDQPSTEAAAATKRCGKSNSTGSSKRWRFKDLLLNRSSSDGKDTFVLVAPSKKRDKIGESKRVVAVAEDDDGISAAGARGSDGKTTGKDEDKRKPPLLPQRADLVSFFANAKGLRRNLNLHPF